MLLDHLALKVLSQMQGNASKLRCCQLLGLVKQTLVAFIVLLSMLAQLYPPLVVMLLVHQQCFDTAG